MLVRLPDHFLSASRCQSETIMAPFSASFDYRSQIIDNCEFFVAKYDIVSVITVRDPSGLFKAYAIRSNQDTRDVLLSSDPSNVVLKAITSLHAKSCEAAHHYITANGFSHPPDLKKTRFEEEDEKDEDNDNDDAVSFVSSRSASSTVALSYWSGSDDEAAMTPVSSADRHAGCRRETCNGNEKGNSNNTSRRRSSKPPAGCGKQAREPVPRFPADPYDSDDERHQQLPPRIRLLSPVRSGSAANNGTSYRPPPPPPGWTGPPMPPPPPARAIPIPTPQSQPGPRYYQHQHHPSPGQPIPPPLPPPTAGLTSVATQPKTGANHPAPTPEAVLPPPFPGPMRIHNSTANTSALHYKASAPALNSSHRNSATSLITQQQQHRHSPPPPSNPPQPQRLYDVRLTIRFGRGEQRILESSRPSVRALQETAIAYVRTHPAAFGASSPSPADGPQRQPAWGGLRACVRNAYFGPGEAYDMSAYRGDDLTRLFGVLNAGLGVPRFEVEVEEFAAAKAFDG
ncbi:hypothetical protein F4818DRAFT_326393 [Hypoxylon cercidicola]|nr:hypothetical protein F4818DRAFT_326393 [Hypoxylon cercidicola]